jgi:hypothetical protein
VETGGDGRAQRSADHQEHLSPPVCGLRREGPSEARRLPRWGVWLAGREPGQAVTTRCRYPVEMGPAWDHFLARAAEPHATRRRDESLHVYLLPAQRLIWNTAGVLIFIGPAVKVAEQISLSQIQDKPALDALLLLLFLLPAAWFTWGMKFGVFVSAGGVRSVSASRVSLTPWSEIARFVVDDSRPRTVVRLFDRGGGRGVCVWAEHPDGGRTPLEALSLRPVGAATLDRYCEALNGELAARRGAAHVAA